MKVSTIIENIEASIFFCILLCNLSITKAFGRGLLIQEILIIILVFINIIYIRNIKFYIFNIFLIVFPILLNYKNIVEIEFMKSFIMIIVYWDFIYLIKYFRNKEKCLLSFIKGMNILIIFSLVQFIVRFINIKYLLDIVNSPFGNSNLLRVLDQSYLIGLPRANSLMYEPSIFGVYSLLAFTVCIYLRQKISDKYKIKIYILPILGVLLSGSAIAYSGLCIIIISRVILVKYKPLVKFPSIIIGCISGVFIMSKILYRFNEIFIAGTSGYYRVISPIMLIKDMFLSGDIFGIGIGNLQQYIIDKNPIYMLKNGYEITLGLTIDNSMLMVILTFGVVSFPLIIYVICLIIKYISYYNYSIVIGFIFVAISTGGYNFIYFNLALGVLILALKGEHQLNYNKMIYKEKIYARSY